MIVLLNEQAYLHLKHMIIKGELSPDEIYSETKLSKKLGVSRTPFRDAIHRLAQEGYIDIIPSKGFILHKLTRQDVDETFQIRSALECYCTLQIAENADSLPAQKLIGELRQTIEMLKEILDTTRSIEEFCEYDFQFHAKIVEYMQNQQFINIFNSFKYRMRKLAELSLTHENRLDDTYREHLDIVNAMESKDTKHIYTITQNHMNAAMKINLEHLLID